MDRNVMPVLRQISSPASAVRAWRASLPRELRHRSTLRGVWYFTRGVAIYVALFLGLFLLPSWWMRGACLLALPFAIGGLFVIGHDAAHHSLTRLRRLNELIGRLAMLPALHPFTSWSYAHNALHHGGTCLKGRHPDFPPFSKEEFDRLPPWRRTLERIYRAPFGVGLAYTFDFYVRYLLFPRGSRRSPHSMALHLDRLLVVAFCGLQIGVAYALAAPVNGVPIIRALDAAVAVVVPWTLWIYFMGVASFVQHTHPRTAWYDDESEWSFCHVQLRSTTHMRLPWPLGPVLHNIMDHPAHHLDPTIPLYELPTSQRLLELQAPADSVVASLTWREYQRICEACKLYDYRRHCWLDFNGQPTTAIGLHARQEAAN